MENSFSRGITYKRLWESHLLLRGLLGVLGLLLPFALLIWGTTLADPIEPPLNSISDYYHHPGMGHLFVGTLMAIGFFLAAYQGYDRIDNLAGWLAGAFALGVAFFPNQSQYAPIAKLHFGFAVGLFLVLSFFSIFLFTKTKPKEDIKWYKRIPGIIRSNFGKNATKKDQRNLIYVICGLVMIGLMVFYGLFKLAIHAWSQSSYLKNLDNSTLLFWVETFMLLAFGISWIIKGNWLWLLSDTEGNSA